jgi:hypothetical protein
MNPGFHLALTWWKPRFTSFTAGPDLHDQLKLSDIVLAHRGEGPAFSYAGQPMHILAGHGGSPPGFAAMELTIPPHFAGPIPHAHDEFDEAIYVLNRCRAHAGHPARP